MLPPKPKQISSSHKQTNNPYSLLSLGLTKLPGSHINSRMLDQRDPIYNEHNNDKDRKEPQNKKSQNQQRFENIARKVKVQKKLIAQAGKHNIPRKQGKEESTFGKVEFRPLREFKEDVLNDRQVFRFENITNQMIDESPRGQGDKQNCSLVGNYLSRIAREESEDKDQNLVINLKKKIKKLSKSKRLISTKSSTNEMQIMLEEESQQFSHHRVFSQRETIAMTHASLLRHPFSDVEVIPQAFIYRNKLKSQRIDNDVDTDDEQVTSGIKRIHRFLVEGIQMMKEEEKNN